MNTLGMKSRTWEQPRRIFETKGGFYGFLWADFLEKKGERVSVGECLCLHNKYQMNLKTCNSNGLCVANFFSFWVLSC